MHDWLTNALPIGLVLIAIAAGFLVKDPGSGLSSRSRFHRLLAALMVAAFCSTMPVAAVAAGSRVKHSHQPASRPSTSSSVSTRAALGPFFPKGMMRFASTDYGAMKAAGFNTVSDANDVEVLNQLAAQGLKGFVWLGAWNHGSCSWEYSDGEVARIVQGVKGHPALLAYELGDEPLQTPCSNAPNAYRIRSALVHSLDAAAITFTIDDEFNDPSSTPATVVMKGSVDVLAFDVYPCQIGQACDFSMIDRAVKAIHAQGISTWWAVMQDFQDDVWRFPTASELHQQYLHWAGNGMSGYLFFSWDYLGNNLQSQPGNLEALTTDTLAKSPA